MNYKNILIAVDGSSCSKKAAAVGIELAQKLSASVHVLCVIDMTSVINSTAIVGVMNNEIISVMHEEAEELVKDIAEKYSSGKISTITVEGIPQYEIGNIAKAHNTDLIVMGTHGKTGLSHLLMGSVAEHVVRHSEIPVLVVPERKKA